RLRGREMIIVALPLSQECCANFAPAETPCDSLSRFALTVRGKARLAPAAGSGQCRGGDFPGDAMIPVGGYAGARVAVLGLGRSGLAVARALAAGGAEPLLWDDSPEARARAEAAGFTLFDLTRGAAWDDVAALV